MGNIDTKLSSVTTPYYIVSDKDEYLNTDSNSIWLIKRANFNNECKNATLFEFNNSNSKTDPPKTTKQLTFALNQIKTLKTLRHPNIVKYFYSEETTQLNQSNNFKCLLITEYIRPLTNILNELSNEQIIHGIHGLTNAINFLHEKVSLSHNNINESCIYLNSKQSWKLNNFELAIQFSNLNKQSLSEILEFKNKNSITPEEEANSANKYDLDTIFKQCPHSIDAYGWAMCIVNILPNVSSTENDLQQLEIYLSQNPLLRPTFQVALSLKLFDFNKPASLERYSTSKTSFNPYEITNLDDLEINFTSLIDYLANLSVEALINEKLIDFLLSPFMFFSNKVRKQLFPSLFIPKEVSSSALIDHFYFYSLNSNKDLDNLKLKPFLSLNNYKAFVIPRVLTLFSMRSTQIRLGLLEYFPFYAPHINDNDTLRYELLPELLMGLKDKNDELVSVTFSCLSVMVKLLGSQIVVGNANTNGKQSDRIKSIFSDNLPKRQLTQLLDASKKLNSFASLDEEMMLLMLKREDNLSISESNQKLFSDSMIGLHDDTDDASTTTTMTKNDFKVNGYKLDDDEWSSDFAVAWSLDNVDSDNKKEKENSLELSSKTSNNKIINDNFDQFDIKNMKSNGLDKKEDDLENFFNDMQPVIKKTTLSLNEIGKGLNDLNVIKTPSKMVPLATVDQNNCNWECEEIVDLDE